MPAVQAPAVPAPCARPGSPTQETAPPVPAVAAQPAGEDDQNAGPWTSDADPVRRPRWYTDAELQAVQLVATGDGAYWVIVAGERLGLVQPHHGATGGRSGWEARRRGGGMAWHLGTGVRGGGTHPATRKAAVTDLIAAVHHAWINLQRP
ncbi:hypothetical protein ACOZ38_21055 [Sphaerisporangium viridialbum]|uniref:hypothetical protein n=1 Tax=Sphaerisporangium viridialbum TaxID=46189 RepID=UPI003C780C09